MKGFCQARARKSSRERKNSHNSSAEAAEKGFFSHQRNRGCAQMHADTACFTLYFSSSKVTETLARIANLPNATVSVISPELPLSA